MPTGVLQICQITTEPTELYILRFWKKAFIYCYESVIQI